MNHEDQMQLDELSHPSKAMFAQACNRWALATLFAALMVERWARIFCRGFKRDGSRKFNVKLASETVIGSGSLACANELPSPQTETNRVTLQE